MTRTAKAVIDLAALRHNLNKAKEAAANSNVLAVIKANAYGHGMLNVLSALDAADGFAVACIDEALALRQITSKRIVVLQGIHEASQLSDFIENQIDCVVHQSWQVEAMESYVPIDDERINVWLKIDTGMHRLGVPAEQVGDLITRLEAMPLTGGIQLMTHMACADDRSDKFTLEQIAEFDRVTSAYDYPASLSNSASTLGWESCQRDWVRPGIMLYGVSPFLETTGVEFGLKPVMRLSTKLIAINQCKMGDSIGYGSSWVCPKDMTIGVAAIGYGDGYPRHAPSGTPVFVKNKEAHLVGRVSMDMITIDLTGRSDVQVGDEVVLWGEELPVERVAEAAETIAYELLCHIYGHVKYEYKGL